MVGLIVFLIVQLNSFQSILVAGPCAAGNTDHGIPGHCHAQNGIVIKALLKKTEIPYGDIEKIVVEGQNRTVIKTRSGDEFGTPSQAVNSKKQEKYFFNRLSFLENLCYNKKNP